jgi:lipoprotein-anchoring transpeptidase ErfK/SrfK
MLHRLLPLLVLLLLVTAAVFSYTPAKREIAYKLGISGDTTTDGDFGPVEQIENAHGDFDENAGVAMFNNQLIDYPKTSLAQEIAFSKATAEAQTETDSNSKVLGTTNANGEEKWIEVSLAQQMLRAWEGNNIVMEFSISSGKWYPTPKGTYNIWYKTRSQTMKGGSKDLGTYYNLPNVPHNMFFYKGYAVHGAYWHNNFGNPMSHGCVNAPLDKVGSLFEWTGPVVPSGKNVVRASNENPGTKVFVH